MSAPTESTSGIKTAEDGSRYAGGSTRKDGSVRKILRIRAGYAPLEDVRKFVPRARRLQQGNNEGAIIPRKQTDEEKVETKERIESKVKIDTENPKIGDASQGSCGGRGSADEVTEMLSNMSITKPDKGDASEAREKEKIYKAQTEDDTKQDISKGYDESKKTMHEKPNTHADPETKQNTKASAAQKTRTASASILKGNNSKDTTEIDDQDTRNTGSSGLYVPPSRRK